MSVSVCLLSVCLHKYTCNIWGSYGQEFGVLFFETQCISPELLN